RLLRLTDAEGFDQCARTQSADFATHAIGANCALPGPVEDLNGKHFLRPENVIARQRFCPLQRFELVIFFRLVRRTRHGTGRKVSASELFALVSLLAAASRTEALLSRPALNLAATARAIHGRVTARGAIAIARGLPLF